MSAPRYGSVEDLRIRVEQQRRFMEDCGWNRMGYVRNYGSKNDPNHYGDGGEAIYEADRAVLDKLTERLNEKEARYGRS